MAKYPNLAIQCTEEALYEDGPISDDYIEEDDSSEEGSSSTRVNQPDLVVQVSFDLCDDDVKVQALTLSGEVLLDDRFSVIDCATREMQLAINCAAKRSCKVVLPDGSILECKRIPWMADLMRQQGLEKMFAHVLPMPEQDEKQLLRNLMLAWRWISKYRTQKDPELEYPGYFESELHCGMHALNNALGAAFHTPESMSSAINVYLETARHKGLPEVRAMHKKPNGWYSKEVLAQALTTISTRRPGVVGYVGYVLDLEPLFHNPEKIKISVGSVININNSYWVALRWMHDRVWLLDAEEKRPILLTWQSYTMFIHVHNHAYCIKEAQQNKMLCAR